MDDQGIAVVAPKFIGVMTLSALIKFSSQTQLSWSPFFGQAEAVFKLGFAPVHPKAVARWLRTTPSRCRGCKQRDNADYQAALASRPK